jgi:hypothetical protein
MKYYVKTDFDKKPVALFRFENSPTEFFQEVWIPSKKSWVASETLGEMLIGGEVFLFDIDEDVAQKVFPAAFADHSEAPVVPNGSSPVAIG